MRKNKRLLRIFWGVLTIAGWSALTACPAPLTGAEEAPERAAVGDAPVSSQLLAGPKLSREFRTESLRGNVVWYGAALRKTLGITTVEEATERVLAIATKDGQLLPIIEDLRGRAFRTDERLRQMDVELRVRRYQATPAVQVLRVYEWRDGQKYQVDYWCDVCAIVMFETGPCACCQDHNRLRQRAVEK